MKKGAWINGRPVKVKLITEYDVRVANAHAVAKAIVAIAAANFDFAYQRNDAIKITSNEINKI